MCFRPPSIEEAGESVCSSCGSENPKGSTVCVSCGKELLSVPKAAMGGSAIPTVPSIGGKMSVPKVPSSPKAAPLSVPKTPVPPK